MDLELNRMPPHSTVGKPRRLALWTWMALACAFLVASGAGRGWQDHRFGASSGAGETCPVLLADLPEKVGDWQLVEGGETKLDPRVALIAGSSDHLVRTYVDNLTGVKLTLLVLVGPARVVFAHTPSVCYSSAGYKAVDVPMRMAIPLGPGCGAGDFRSEVFTRGEGGSAEREEVTHAFRFDGRWVPDASESWRHFRHGRVMFKVQTSRRVAENECRHFNDPSGQFLGRFLPELEQRITASQGGRAG